MGGTELVDYGSDLDNYSPEHHIYVTILNEHDQDDLTTNAPQDEDEARRTAH